MLGTVSTLGERCELGGAGHRESRIARRNALDDIASRLTLVYPVAHLSGGRNGFRSAVVADAGLVERSQEARLPGWDRRVPALPSQLRRPRPQARQVFAWLVEVP